MFAAEHLVKRFFGVTVVDDVSFGVGAGEVVGYLGPNGAGKTTTTRMLAGLLEPSSGTVRLEGSDVSKDLVSFRKRLGYVPEEPHLYTFLSGREIPWHTFGLSWRAPRSSRYSHSWSCTGTPNRPPGRSPMSWRSVHERQLTQLFLRRFLENDLASSDADRHEILSVAGAAMISLGLFVTILLSVKYLFRPFQSPDGPLLRCWTIASSTSRAR